MSHRSDRVGDQLRKEIADLLAREVHDPGIGFITITRVQVTPDLQHARVFYTSLGSPAARRDTSRALERVAPFLRHRIAKRIRLRRAPELQFTFDESVAGQDRVEQLLREIHERDGNDPGQAPGDGK